MGKKSQISWKSIKASGQCHEKTARKDTTLASGIFFSILVQHLEKENHMFGISGLSVTWSLALI